MDRLEINKDDYISWRNNPITEAFLQETIDAMDGQFAHLANSAGLNSLEDRYRVGVINGLRALADWEPSFKEEVDTDGTSN